MNSVHAINTIHAAADNARERFDEALDPAWPEPTPLAATQAPEPYPLGALPAAIRDAVSEVQAFVQAPLPLVASCALSSLSIAGQHLADVRRAQGLSGPIGLYLLTVAASGERKSQTDKLFTSPIHQWEREQARRAEPDRADYSSRRAAWDARREGYLASIKAATKSGKSSKQAEQDLVALEHDEPKAPRVPLLIRADSTPEALAYALAHDWPSAAVLSAEAGTVLGGHAMSREAQMRNLALLNTVWDGGAMHINRRTSPSYTLRGCRLTVGLQGQPATVSAFAAQADGLARGMGFFARFLVAWPGTTQGTRLYREPPTSWPALTTYTSRLTDLLDIRPSLGDDGALDPPAMDLSPEAKSLWVELHDAIERELVDTGDLTDVRDVASKGADNAARLAALFEIHNRGPGGTVGPEALHAAGQLVGWHLFEAQRFFGGLAVSAEVSRAMRLTEWLVSRCTAQKSNRVGTREVLRLGPSALREKATMERAVADLVEAGHVRVEEGGRQRNLLVNPALLGGTHGAA